MLRTLLCACALALALPTSAAAGAAQTLTLDLADPANAEPGGVATQSGKLRKGTNYVVTISGTGSLWHPNEDQPVDCGAPEDTQIAALSPETETTPPTVDAAVVFAVPRGLPFLGGFACVPPTSTAPPAQAALRMGTSGRLAAATPIGGQPTVAAADHTYAYAVRGRGRPLQFQYADPLVYDNTGVLEITIRPASACRRGACPGVRRPPRRARRAGALPCVFPSLPASAGRPADLELCA